MTAGIAHRLGPLDDSVNANRFHGVRRRVLGSECHVGRARSGGSRAAVGRRVAGERGGRPLLHSVPRDQPYQHRPNSVRCTRTIQRSLQLLVHRYNRRKQ
jgi:hypothetical protein